MKFDFRKVLLSNYTLVGISSISNMLVRAGTFLVVAPILGPTDQGTLVVVSAWSALFCIIVGYGFNVRALKMIPANLDDAYAIIYGDLKTMVPLTALTALTALAVTLIFLPSEDWLVFWIVLFATVGTRIIDYSSAVLRSLNRFLTETKLALTSCILQFSLVVSAGLIFRSLLAVAIALLCSRAVMAVLAIFTISRQSEVIDTKTRGANTVSYTLKNSFAYAADSTIAIFLQQVDVIVLNALADREAVGIYGAGSRLIQLMLAIPWVVTNISVPAIGRSKTEEERQRHLNQLRLVMTGAGIAGAIGLLVFGPIFTNYFLGEAFSPLNALWPIFTVLVIARFAEAYMAILMLVDDRVAQRAVMQTVALLTIVAGGFLLVPIYSVSGMIVAIGASALISALYYVRRLSDKVFPPRRAILILSVIVAVAFVVLMEIM